MEKNALAVKTQGDKDLGLLVWGHGLLHRCISLHVGQKVLVDRRRVVLDVLRRTPLGQ